MDCMKPNQVQEDKDEKMYPPLIPISDIFATSTLSLTISAVFELETPITDTQIIHFLCNKFVPFNVRLSSIICTDMKGVHRWKKVDVKVEDHMKTPTFPVGLSPTKYQELFEEYLLKLSHEGYQEGIPLWAVHLFKYPTRKGSMTVVFKLNHALGDGYSFIGQVLKIFQRADDPLLSISLPTLSFKGNETRGCHYFHVFSLCKNTIQDGLTNLFKASITRDHRNVIHSMAPGVEFEPISLAYITISLEHIKQIKSKVEGTVNDVVTGLIFYIIHLYKLRMGQVSGGKTRMTTKVMFNTRALKGYKSIDEMVNQNIWGNRALALQMPIPCFSHKVEPLEFIIKAKTYNKRLKNSMYFKLLFPFMKVVKSLKGLKGSRKGTREGARDGWKPLIRFEMSDIAHLMADALISRRMNGYHPSLAPFPRSLPQPLAKLVQKGIAEFVHSNFRNSSTSITNIIGPNQKIAIEGHAINDFYFTVTGLPQSLVFTIISYMGEMKLVATMEKNFIDSQVMVSCMNEAYEKIFAAMISK